MNRVVITGYGIYSCIGKNIDAVKESLYHGKSGIVLDALRKEFGYRSGLTGYLEPPYLKELLDRRSRLMLPEQGEYAYLATLEALKNANLDQDYIDKHDVGILYGNDSSAKPIIDAIDIIREKKNTMFAGSGSVFQSLNSTVTMNLATIFRLKGVNFTLSAACASGSHAIGLGYHFIKTGLQDCIVCGGAQETNIYSMGNFDALSAFSIREDEPTKASRPFDRDRDGLVPSGGGATVILESLESALKRGAPIYGEVIGYGFSSNGGHISNPTVDGPVKAIHMSLKDANVQANEIDYINAHATSTPVGDASEAQALHTVFGDTNAHISSTKSMTGHECWMAGASEIIYSLIMMRDGFVAPNINFENPDEYSAKLNIADKKIDKKIDVFLSNSFGFGGTNSALVVKKYKD
ncbi:MAG: beta-ketoacyl-[acyl-carrier-protein] synthase family protein [Saprospirales bacterium]|nr:beta-ketoacyl-[acyl-carrier-protein] synthase family protein [Saprospirales bacterium]MBK8350561.1 beta-ketoacyl-[acyl-carrier-protein] synthase family protein [Saprospirales bacterium]